MFLQITFDRSIFRYFIFDVYKSEEETIDLASKIMIFLGICVFLIIMSGVKVVYGRYSPNCSSLWGMKINARTAWLVQVDKSCALIKSNTRLSTKMIFDGMCRSAPAFLSQYQI